MLHLGNQIGGLFELVGRRRQVLGQNRILAQLGGEEGGDITVAEDQAVTPSANSVTNDILSQTGKGRLRNQASHVGQAGKSQTVGQGATAASPHQRQTTGLNGRGPINSKRSAAGAGSPGDAIEVKHAGQMGLPR